jgi:hypothetical protein
LQRCSWVGLGGTKQDGETCCDTASVCPIPAACASQQCIRACGAADGARPGVQVRGNGDTEVYFSILVGGPMIVFGRVDGVAAARARPRCLVRTASRGSQTRLWKHVILFKAIWLRERSRGGLCQSAQEYRSISKMPTCSNFL